MAPATVTGEGKSGTAEPGEAALIGAELVRRRTGLHPARVLPDRRHEGAVDAVALPWLLAPPRASVGDRRQRRSGVPG